MYRNLTDALLGSLRLLFSVGATVPSRNGETKELYSHQIRIKNPTERVLITPHRGANIFAQLAESMWIMAGRDDMEFLSKYLPRARDFSDDGKTWRGGYGPRLRMWPRRAPDPNAYSPGGSLGDPTLYVDQLEECVKHLCEDPTSRRAVMVIFDPDRDFTQSKDIPCNNWLHFLVRDGKLNLTVGIRSNDAIWGFSGINVFEWSILQQFVAHWLDVEVGTMAYTASSFHLYDYHYEKAQKILASSKGKTLYDFGVPQIPFELSFEEFNAAMGEFFYFEKLDGKHETELHDPFLDATLKMLDLYNAFQREEEVGKLAELLNKIPPSDLRVGALEFLLRQKSVKETDLLSRVSLSPEEKSFFEWYQKPVASEISIKEIYDTLKVLHEKKSRSYGNSWKKHGEVLGVFSNITRKRDRIMSLAKGATGTSDEGMIDTIADLCVYSAKYLTLIAEMYPVAFTDFLQPFIGGQTFIVDADGYTGNEGFDRTVDMLQAHPFLGNNLAPRDLEESLKEIEKCYVILEEILTVPNRKERGQQVTPAAAAMGLYCALAIQYMAKESPSLWASYVITVEGL